MSKEVKIEDVLAQKLVLVQDPILGSRYELQPNWIKIEIEIEETESTDDEQ